MVVEQYIVLTDQQLVEKAIEGDTVAFEQLFSRYRASILQFCLTRTSGNRQDADDLLQETFIKVYLNLSRYDARYTFGQWIFTIGRNTFVDYVRKRRGDLPMVDILTAGTVPFPATTAPTPEESFIRSQQQAQMEQHLGRMSPRYRQLIELRFFREYSYEEISAELKLPMGTVKTQIHRAREQLCKFITEQEER